jgi:hypothetical protein
MPEEAFDLKRWIDAHVLPILEPDPRLQLHSVLQNRPPGALAPVAVAVWTLSAAPDGWAPAVKRVLELPGFSFDFLRAPQLVTGPGQEPITLFGGDGAPFFNRSGGAMARLFRRCGDIDLILEIGHRFPSAEAAAAAVKSFFHQFADENPFDVIKRNQPPFGMV